MLKFQNEIVREYIIKESKRAVRHPIFILPFLFLLITSLGFIFLKQLNMYLYAPLCILLSLGWFPFSVALLPIRTSENRIDGE